jgi:hypothetical protein
MSYIHYIPKFLDRSVLIPSICVIRVLKHSWKNRHLIYVEFNLNNYFN